jgi:hypothetical protein
MRPLFPDDMLEHNKKPNVRQDRRFALIGHPGSPTRRHIAKFALQAHRNFGSLASCENC